MQVLRAVFRKTVKRVPERDPLLYQPGTKWQYGVGHDWATILIERLTGTSMQDHCTTHIFAPPAMSSTTLDAHMPPWGPGRVFPPHTEVMPDETPCVLAPSPEAFMSRSGAPPSETGPFWPENPEEHR